MPPPHHEPPSHLLTSWMVTQKSKKEPDTQWLSEEALQIAEERREAKGRKGKIYTTVSRVPENSKER